MFIKLLIGNIYKEVCCLFGMISKMPEAYVFRYCNNKVLACQKPKGFF